MESDMQPQCDHDYEREPYAGTTLVYVCTKCGDEYERDVS